METKDEMKTIEKEDLQAILDDVIRYSRARAMFFRIALITIVCLGLVYFIGFGGQNLVQYAVLLVMLAAAYGCGKNDFKQSWEESDAMSIKQAITDAEGLDIKIKSIFDDDDEELDQ